MHHCMWYVDGSDFLSCFARYYARSSSDKEKQNVSVERLSEWTDSHRAVCFIATKDISEQNVSPSLREKAAALVAAAFGN